MDVFTYVEQKKHEKFLKLRSEHYNMREALKHAHELMSQDEDEDNTSLAPSSTVVPPLPRMPNGSRIHY